ncbi:HupE / UreJ protein [Sulfitobacter brevis]|uniref:HupE / UreJ protein n=1 Tax=Sulfitobacter brevis TaxID=74348 RepID=A0A1I1UU61_9RHOB|nr:HupE / UreJ protein [Sulfitobacter brevis]
MLAVASQAHEVQPTIGDLTVADGKAELVLRINLEAFLSGIDLDEIADTNNAENAEDYDALRELSAEEIEARAPGLLKGWNTLPLIEVDGTPVPLQSISVAVPRDVNIESPRVAEWRLAGDVAQGASQVIVRWPDGAGAMVLRQQGVEEPFTGYLDGGQTSEAIALGGGGQQSTLQAFVTYIPIGFDHILPKGLDHILFVLGLFLLSTHLRPLLWQVSAFTLAHTVTLALGAMGWVTVPAAIVEPLIAASIVFVAVENIYSSGLSRWRPLVVFGFGLLHGLGFASVLGEFGLPEGQFLPALIGFNVGVEFGQLTVIAVAAVLIWLALQAARASKLQGDEIMIQEREVLFRAVSITGSLIIALIGAYWVVERVFL